MTDEEARGAASTRARLTARDGARKPRGLYTSPSQLRWRKRSHVAISYWSSELSSARGFILPFAMRSLQHFRLYRSLFCHFGWFLVCCWWALEGWRHGLSPRTRVEWLGRRLQLVSRSHLRSSGNTTSSQRSRRTARECWGRTTTHLSKVTTRISPLKFHTIYFPILSYKSMNLFLIPENFIYKKFILNPFTNFDNSFVMYSFLGEALFVWLWYLRRGSNLLEREDEADQNRIINTTQGGSCERIDFKSENFTATRLSCLIAWDTEKIHTSSWNFLYFNLHISSSITQCWWWQCWRIQGPRQ